MNWNEKFSHKIGFTKVLDLDKTMTENISKADKNSVNKTDINCGTLQLLRKSFWVICYFLHLNQRRIY